MGRRDFNVIVIGGGSAGLTASLTAADLKARVLLIEKSRMGGERLYRGCVPSKAFLQSARRIYEIQTAGELGIRHSSCEFEFSGIMERARDVIKKTEPKDSRERYEALGVECVKGSARFEGLNVVRVGERRFTAGSFIVATGSVPIVPPVPGLSEVDYLTSDTLWSLRDKPDKLLVMGGGPTGVELAQGVCRLGVPVTLLETAPRILQREDPEVSQSVSDKLRKEGMEILTSVKTEEIKKTEAGGGGEALLRHRLTDKRIPFSHILIAVGRRAWFEGLGLKELGVKLTDRGFIRTNSFLATNHSHIYACGDVTGPYLLTHSAGYQGALAAIHSLFSPFSRLPFLPLKAVYDRIPYCVYTDPEVSRWGLSEAVAKDKGVSFKVTRIPLKEIDRAVTDGSEEGFVKVLTKKRSDKILGMTALGYRAGDWTGELVLAAQRGLGLNEILKTIHPYPSMTETGRRLALNWKKGRVSDTTHHLLEWFHRQRR